MSLLLANLRECVPHYLSKRRHQLVNERGFHTKYSTEASCPAQHPAEHVPATFIGGNRPISNCKAQGSKMICNHSVGDTNLSLNILRSCDFSNGLENRSEKICAIIGINTLEYATNSLQPHSRVYTFCWQRRQLAIITPVELNENKVPNFNHPSIIGIDQWSPTAIIRHIDVNLTAGTTWARIPHFPEVFFLAKEMDMIRIDISASSPEFRSFLIRR